MSKQSYPSLLRFVASVLFLAVSTLSWAYDFEADGIYYRINSDGTSVSVTYESTDYNSYSGSVVIPSTVTYNSQEYSVTTIGSNAFRECPNLTSVTIPNSVTAIKQGALYGCSSLASVKMPSSVTEFSGYVFYECTSLTSIDLPEGVTEIDNYTFYNCTGLKSVSIPSTVTSIGARAFGNCSALEQITCFAEQVPETSSLAFQGTDIASVTLYVLESALDSYKSAAPWKDFGTIIRVIASVDYTTNPVTINGTPYGVEGYPFDRNDPPTGASYDVQNGALTIVNNSDEGNQWDLSMLIVDKFSVQEGCDYIVRIEYMSSVAGSVDVWFGGWDSYLAKYNVPITATDNYQTLELEFKKPTFSSEGNSHVLWQCRKVVGTIKISKVEVFEKAGAPTKDPVWTNIIANSDLSGNDMSCFYQMVYPQAEASQSSVTDGAIVINSPAKTEADWETSFFIVLPQTLPAGTPFKVSFKCKASTATTITPQCHNAPLQYIHWNCFGEVPFSTEWTTFETTAYVPDACDGSDHSGYKNDFRTICFNLARNQDITYYFDNIVVAVDEAIAVNPQPFPVDDGGSTESVIATFYLGEISGVSDPEGFFTHDTEGKWNFNSKYGGGEYDGTSYTMGLKMEASTSIYFTTTETTVVTIVQSTTYNEGSTIKFDGEELPLASATAGTGCRIYTLKDIPAGDHIITRGSGESGLYYIKVAKEKPTYLVGDANGNGEVEIGDVTSVLTLMATPEATGYDNKAADANGNGEIEIGDVTTILTIMANGN